MSASTTALPRTRESIRSETAGIESAGIKSAGIKSAGIKSAKSGSGVAGIVFGSLVFFASLGNTVDVNLDPLQLTVEDQLGLDWLVAIKLGIAGCCGIAGVFAWVMEPRIRKALLSGPGMLLTGLALVLIGTSFYAYSEVRHVAQAAALMNLGYLLFVPAALIVLGLPRILVLMLLGLVFNLVVNWGLYWIVPSVGVFEESLTDQTLIERMGGLGHPNAIARTAVLAGLLSLVMLRSGGLQVRILGRQPLLIAILAMAVATGVATLSRTALAAAVVAISFLFCDKLFTRWGVTLAFTATLCGLAAAFATGLSSTGAELTHSALRWTTKTGDVEELTSATGRTEIWAEAIRLIQERPLTGWGLNSAPVLMEEFSQHTHNLLLHALFSGGILAGLLILGLLIWTFVFGLTSTTPLIRAISAYLLVSGLFEDTALNTFASPSMLLWTLVLLLPAMSAPAVVARRSSVPSARGGGSSRRPTVTPA